MDTTGWIVIGVIAIAFLASRGNSRSSNGAPVSTPPPPTPPPPPRASAAEIGRDIATSVIETAPDLVNSIRSLAESLDDDD